MHITLKPAPEAPNRHCPFCGQPCIGIIRTKKQVVYIHVMRLHHERRLIVDREITEQCTITEDGDAN